jgi:hypothetical protein
MDLPMTGLTTSPKTEIFTSLSRFVLNIQLFPTLDHVDYRTGAK